MTRVSNIYIDDKTIMWTVFENLKHLSQVYESQIATVQSAARGDMQYFGSQNKTWQ